MINCTQKFTPRNFLQAAKQSPNKDQIIKNLNYTQKNIPCASHPCEGGHEKWTQEISMPLFIDVLHLTALALMSQH
jgi:hypothetical protein